MQFSFSLTDPIVCDCTIAWLIARNQNLLRNIDNQAKCSNGHLFTQLNENDYDETSCPQANEASDM